MRTSRPSACSLACAPRTRRRDVRRAIVLGLMLLVLAPAPAAAQEGCSNVLVYTIPGVRWGDVDRLRPPEIVRAIDDGAAATMAVRTNVPITGYASGFLTI